MSRTSRHVTSRYRNVTLPKLDHHTDYFPIWVETFSMAAKFLYLFVTHCSDFTLCQMKSGPQVLGSNHLTNAAISIT